MPSFAAVPAATPRRRARAERRVARTRPGRFIETRPLPPVLIVATPIDWLVKNQSAPRSTAFRLVSFGVHRALELVHLARAHRRAVRARLRPAATIAGVAIGALVVGMALGAATLGIDRGSVSGHHACELGAVLGIAAAAAIIAAPSASPPQRSRSQPPAWRSPILALTTIWLHA